MTAIGAAISGGHIIPGKAGISWASQKRGTGIPPMGRSGLYPA
jgi:hypothetical protein